MTRRWPGSVPRDDLLDGYERVAGWRPDPEELHWWEVFGTLRWLVLGRFQAREHHSGAEPSAEFAAIGRRVLQSRWDVLARAGAGRRGDAAPDPVPETEPHGDLHGLPGVSDLLDAVIEELGGGIAPSLTDPGAAYRLKICASLLQVARRDNSSAPASGQCTPGVFFVWAVATKRSWLFAFEAGCSMSPIEMCTPR